MQICNGFDFKETLLLKCLNCKLKLQNLYLNDQQHTTTYNKLSVIITKKIKLFILIYIYIYIYIPNEMQLYTVYFVWKPLYMFRVVPPPIIRRANNCIYSIWYLSHRYCYLPLWRQVAVLCAPDDG